MTALYGLVAEFDTPERLRHATERAAQAGYQRLEAYAPFPIDGLAEALGFHQTRVPLIVLPIGDEALERMLRPKYGFGRAFNPCVDCRIAMFRGGRRLMEELGADLVVSGEILGQRPMSQKRLDLAELQQAPIAKLLAEAIRSIHDATSVSVLFI